MMMGDEACFIPLLDNKKRKIAHEPDWLTGNIGARNLDVPTTGDSPVQQSDLLKPVYMDIVNYGLNYAYQKYKNVPWTVEYLQGT